MTNRLDEIQNRLEKATKGERKKETSIHSYSSSYKMEGVGNKVLGGTGHSEYRISDFDPIGPSFASLDRIGHKSIVLGYEKNNSEFEHPDTDFIANAPDDIRYLLSIIDKKDKLLADGVDIVRRVTAGELTHGHGGENKFLDEMDNWLKAVNNRAKGT